MLTLTNQLIEYKEKNKDENKKTYWDNNDKFSWIRKARRICEKGLFPRSRVIRVLRILIVEINFESYTEDEKTLVLKYATILLLNL